MISNPKALGLALVAVFAMSAMAVSAAQAEKVGEFWAETGTVRVDSVGEGHQVFIIIGKTATCPAGLAGHAAYSGVSTSQTATNIEYAGCHITTLGLSFPITVTQEPGCHYTFTAGTYTTGADLSHGSVHICGSTIDVYTNHHNHTTAIARCQLHIPTQTISGVTYRNGIGPNGKMAVTVELNEVEVKSTTTTDFNTLGCNDHKTETAKFTRSMWAEGTDINGNITGATVTGT